MDIEELVGHYPYENVWGLLVDDDLDSVMPEPEPYEPARLTGNAPADLQAETARLAGEWKLGKLNEISDEQARDDLGRLSSQMMGIVARSARLADGHADAVPDDVVAQGQTAAEKFLLRWRGEADPRHVKAIDTYWICTAEHGLNASTFAARVDGLDRRGLRRGAVLGRRRAVRPAARRRAGVREADARGGQPPWATRRSGCGTRSTPASGSWASAIASTAPRIRGRGSSSGRRGELGSPQIEIAERLEEAALAELERRHPERPLKTNVEYYSALVLDVAEIPPPLAPAMFACSRVAGWSAHILEQKRTGRLFRPSARYVGPAPRSLTTA